MYKSQTLNVDILDINFIEKNIEQSWLSSATYLIYDELVFEVPEKDVKKVSDFIRESMCSVMKLRAPIEVEVSVGDNWGETEKE